MKLLNMPRLIGGLVASPLLAQGATTPAVTGIVANVTAQGAGSVSWTAFPGATGYFVVRYSASDLNCCRSISAPVLPATTLSWKDGTLSTSGTYVYRVYATTPDGTFAGEARVVYSVGVTSSSAPSLRSSVTAIGATGPGMTLSGAGPTSQTVSGISTTNFADGPAPTGLWIDGGVGGASVRWDAVTGATGYKVLRAVAGTTSWTTLTANPITATSLSGDVFPDPRLSYTYQVVAYQSNGHYGAAMANYAPPPPADPTEFTAKQTAEGEVTLTWKNAPGVSKYLLSGPGAPAAQPITSNGTDMNWLGMQTPASYKLTGVPNGTQTWTIASSYEPGGVLTKSDAWPRATVSVGPYSGRYRVTMIGFDVNTQTVGDPFTDGQGDEVYLAAQVSAYNMSTGAWGTRGVVRSLVFGDANGRQGRVVAGTLTTNGGLKSTDAYPLSGGGTPPPDIPKPNTVPMLLWEGAMANDVDAVFIAPSIWESDGNDAAFAGWASWVQKVLDPGKMTQLKTELAASDITPVRHSDASYVGTIAGPGVDHPIGIVTMSPGTAPTYAQMYLALTRRKIEAALSPTSTVGGLRPGVIAVPLRDLQTTDGFGGAYTVYLRVERIP